MANFVVFSKLLQEMNFSISGKEFVFYQGQMEQSEDKFTTDAPIPGDDDEGFARQTDEDWNELLENQESKNTKKNTKWGVVLFNRWRSDRGCDEEFETMTVPQLDEILCQFYAELRSSKGSSYSKSAMICIRSSINRHLQNPPFKRIINIAQDSAFNKSNRMFDSIIRKMKRDGLDTSKHYPPISEVDMSILMSDSALWPHRVFDVNNPKGLLFKVWFDITIHFAQKGRDNMRSLTKSSFELKVDPSGKEYYELKYNESSKSHSASTRERSIPKPVMYASDEARCPVKSLKKYLSLLNPGLESLFQRPKTSIDGRFNFWYDRSLGVNTISNMMPTISKEAGLSTRYTNHSVRATSLTLLSNAVVRAREVKLVSILRK